MKPHLLVSVLVIAACCLAVPLHAAEEVIRSPDGTIVVSLAFLPEGKWLLHSFADTVQSTTSREMVEETRSALSNRETITLKRGSCRMFYGSC